MQLWQVKIMKFPQLKSL